MTAGFTHFFRNFFLTEKAVPQTFSLLECMGEGVLAVFSVVGAGEVGNAIRSLVSHLSNRLTCQTQNGE